MSETTARITLSIAVLLTCTVLTAAPSPALDEYIKKPDASYRWNLRRKGEIGATRYVELTLTSQTWQGNPWRHQLFIILPSKFDNQCHDALMVIGGGAWKDSRASKSNLEALPSDAKLFSQVAEQMKAPVAVLLQVPHQPILAGKYEDAAIAHSFEQFLRTGDNQWPLLLPMVKSAVRAMDTIQEFGKQEWSLDIKKFTVTGASKRGWTTWLTGASDKRVAAIAPMVIDMLNMEKHLAYQKSTWGKFSPMIADYTEKGLDKQIHTPRGKSLQAIVDPFQYREQLQQPKLIIIGTNDRYWPLDSLNLYWDQLEGNKHILYVPNNRHGLKDLARVIGSIRALHDHTANSKSLPAINWDFNQQEALTKLTIKSDKAPRRVRIWLTTSATRDFRQSNWISVDARPADDGHFYEMKHPKSGHAAFFGEVVYDSDTLPFYLSTAIHIQPSK